MRAAHRRRAATLAGMASGGVALGHVLAYVLAEPDGLSRGTRLALTGHGSFQLLAMAACAATVSVLLVTALRAPRRAQSPSPALTALMLTLIQLPIFAGMELLERGFALVRAAEDPAVLLGLVLQPIVAILAALLLSGTERAARVVAERLSRPRRAAREAGAAPAPAEVIPRTAFLEGAPRRAPPLPLAA